MPAPVPIAASTIAAQAFRLMERGPISSFGDDSDQARDAAEQYPLALDACLEAADWSFASVYAELPRVTTLPLTVTADPDLPYLYAMPADIVILREVGDGCTRWRRDRAGLRADDPGPLPVRYTGRIDNEAQLPAMFQTAVSHALAVLLAPRWLGTQAKIEALRRDAQATLKAAMRHDARQSSGARYDGLDEQPDWVSEARSSGYRGGWL